MYSHAIKEEKMETMSKTKVMMVTRNGSWMPATLKKYYGRISSILKDSRVGWGMLTVEYAKTMGAPAVH